ncbi:MAG: T9SS type A sorting domain-containing protein [Bacteroidota bacterium]
MKKLFKCIAVLITVFTQYTMAQQPGDLDSTFNSNGIVTANSGVDNNEVYSVALQTDGKIVVAGYSVNNVYNVSISRYNSDGTIDNTFATGGVYTILIGGESLANSVAIQTDGKIVVGGYSIGSSTSNDFLIMRLNSDGTLDNSFGTNGVVTTDFNGTGDVVNGISIQADGKIVAAGYATPSGGGATDMAVARYNSNGTLDTGFSGDGKVIATMGTAFSEAWTCIIQPDQKIIAGGMCENSTDYDFAMVRYNTDGTPDNSFGTSGIVITDPEGYDEEIYSLAVQSDGKIVAAGYANNDSNDDFAVVRYKPNGTPDSTFDSNGIVITDFFSDDDDAYSVKIQQDGKIILTGYTYNTTITAYVFALARYNTNGSLDNSFGGDGMVTTNINSNDDDIYSSAIQTDGKIVVAGASDNGSDRDLAIARYITGTNVGILEFSPAINSFLIYPNPVDSKTHLQYELANDANISVQLFDVQGKLVSQIMSNQHQLKGEHELNISFPAKQPAGIYLLKISDGKGQVNIKIVKG